MHVISAIKGHIAIALDKQALARSGHRINGGALTREFERNCGVVLDEIQRGGLTRAATRVAIDLQINQLLHRRLAIAHHPGFFATRGGNQFAAYHQQAMFNTGNKPLQQHIATTGCFLREGKSCLDVFTAREVNRNATAMIAIHRFDHHGCVDGLCFFPGFGGAFDNTAFGHWHAAAT